MAINWAQIGSGTTFQALVNVLLLHENPATRPFTKAGADGAIDGLLVGAKVYQAKYHEHPKASHAFADARAEAEAIAKNKAPDSRWASAWKGVDTWVLVTNSPFGPDDDQKWRDEIVPLFATLNLHADYWVESQLEKRLAALPDVQQAFFGGKVRFFLSLPEWFDHLRSEAVLERAYDLPLEGREEAVARIRHFVQHEEARVLLVHGPGGVGKSRLQAEAALTMVRDGLVDTVLCGTRHLAVSADWYVATIPEAPALVILDEPEDPRFIERFLSELKTRVKHWKVIVTSRTPRDPVIAKLTDPVQQIIAEPLELRNLEKDAAIRLAGTLVAPLGFTEEEQRRLTRWLVEVCARPIWMSMAVRILEENRELSDLPSDRYRVARRYVEETIAHSPSALGAPEQVRSVLRWVALYQPVNRQNAAVVDFIAAKTGLGGAAAVDALLTNLDTRRVVTLYGVERRMAELRPDVLRDHLLIDWLTYDDAGTRRPSQSARSLAAELVAVTTGKEELAQPTQLITVLGRMEYRLEGAVRLLDPVADALVQLAETGSTTLEQRRALDLAEPLSFFRPAHTIEIARHLRMRDVPEAIIEVLYLGQKLIERSKIVSELPWLLFDAAHGAETSAERTAILEELLALVEHERPAESPSVMGSDGKRAKELIARILHECHRYRSSFHGEATAIADRWLVALEKGDDAAPREGGRVLLAALLTLERHSNHPGETPLTLHMETRKLRAEGDPGRTALSFRERLWRLVEDFQSPMSARTLAWHFITELHREMSQVADDDASWRAAVSDDLERCLVLAKRSDIELTTLQAARGLCDWHIQFEEEPGLRRVAEAFDALYQAHPEVAPYFELLGANPENDADTDMKAVEALAAKASVDALEAFLAGAQRYTSTHVDTWRIDKVHSLAGTLGRTHGEEPFVIDFAFRHLRQGVASPFFRASLSVVHGRLHALRTAGNSEAVGKTLHDAAAACPIGELTALITALYAQVSIPAVQAFLGEDADFVLHHEERLRALDTRQYFLILGCLLPLRGETVLPLVKERFEALAHEQKAHAVKALWRGFYLTCAPIRDGGNPKQALVDSLLDMSFLVPDLKDFRGGVGSEIERICKRIARKPISWLVERIAQRRDAFLIHNQECEKENRRGSVWSIPNEDCVLVQVVATIPNGSPTHEAIRAMEALLAFEGAEFVSSYRLAELLAWLDPHGVVLSALIASRLSDPFKASNGPQIADNARYAGAYPISSEPWRAIALAACRRVEALALGGKDRGYVYAALLPRDNGSYAGAIDKLHPRWQAAVDAARARLNAETEPALRPFWEWMLRNENASLEHAKGRLEEDLSSMGVELD